jgi:hypothetical protein
MGARYNPQCWLYPNTHSIFAQYLPNVCLGGTDVALQARIAVQIANNQ